MTGKEPCGNADENVTSGEADHGTGRALGPVNARGNSFRARAEARQREYRANILRVGFAEWGHWLDERGIHGGRNFVVPEAHAAAVERDLSGKGVGRRTFQNMLSSQAMCFNLFAPLARDTVLAAKVLRPVINGLAAVREIHFEYTPPADIFGDQTGRGGVDCDVFIEADWNDGERAIIVIETKFVEQDFSSCGFRKAGRTRAGKAVCPSDVGVRADPSACFYVSRKGYHYWERTLELGNVSRARLPETGCAFGGPLWQLWVNHTLAHAEAMRRNACHARFAVCAPRANQALLRGGTVLEEFRQLLSDPTTLGFIDVDELVRSIVMQAMVDEGLQSWSRGVLARYAEI